MKMADYFNPGTSNQLFNKNEESELTQEQKEKLEKALE